MHSALTQDAPRAITGVVAAFAVSWSLGCGTNSDAENRTVSGGEAGTCQSGEACGNSGGGSGGGGSGGGGTTSSATGGSLFIPPDAGLGGASDEEPGCIREQVLFERELPNVMLVVDGSSSMTIPDFDDDMRWEAVKNALIGKDVGLVPRLQSEIRFGLTMYFSSPRSGEPDTGCPVLEQVPVALDNADSVAEALKGVWPRGTTPTGETLERVWPELAALDPQEFRGPRIIVLATDGEPTMCAGARLQEEGRALSRKAVADAFAADVRTFVIAVGSEVGDDHLRELANLGQGYPADDPEDRFYRVFDTAELVEAFSTITGDVQECVFELNGTVMVGMEASGEVTLDGAPLKYRDPDGWHLEAPNRLALDGAACEAIQSGNEAVLDISFPCGVFKPR